MPAPLLDLDCIVEGVVREYLARHNHPERISTAEVRQHIHTKVHARYLRPGRKDSLRRGAITATVRTRLEREYARVEEKMENPSRPGHYCITEVYYQRRH